MGLVQRERDQLQSSLFESEPANWSKRAACEGEDPELFYPFPNQPKKIEQAKRICGGCPVRAECLKEGRREAHGIWGGLTEWERHPAAFNENKVAQICKQCQRLYTPTRYGQRYCSRECLNAYLRDHSTVQCGGPHSARRHRSRGEPVDDLCRMAESLYRTRRRNRGQR